MIFKAATYKNLKGRTGDVELGKATLIVGRNFTGKTTIPDTIKLALLGYHPSLDKTAKGIFALASGDEMEVMVTTDDNAQIGRIWTRSRGGSIARKDYVPMGWPETPVVLLDANAYFGASDRGKADLLFRAARTDLDVRKIQDKLAEIGVKMKFAADNQQAWIEEALAKVEQSRSNAAAAAKRYIGTVQGLASLAAKTAIPLDEDVMQKLTRKRQELQAAEGKVGEAKRLAMMHRQTNTPEEAELDGLRNKSAMLDRDIQTKELEIGKAIRFWEGLLKNADCPMCGSEGESWRKAAQRKKSASDKVLNTELNDLKREKNNVALAGKALAKKVEASRQRLKETDAEKLLDCEEVAAGLREEVGALEKDLEAYAQDQADRRRLTEAKASYDAEDADQKMYATAKTYLLEQKAKLASELFAPILEKTHWFTNGITLGPLQFQDGVLGMARMIGKERVFVQHSAFSGTEQAIVFAALQGALAATAPVKLVVMDELGRIDEANKAQLLRNVHAALEAKVIDQFIGIDTVAPKDTNGFAIVERK